MVKKRSGDSKLAASIYREVEELTVDLVGLGLVDHQNYVSITDEPNGAWSVSQSGAKLNLALKKLPYEKIYLNLIDALSYNLLLLDGAMIQFSYQGLGENLIRHRLAYLPSPTLRPYQDDPELYLLEQAFIEIVGHQVVPVPVRFDYDNRDGVAKDVVHPVAHVTLGQYQHCRIPATRALSPRAFVQFILDSFYSTPDMDRVLLREHVTEGDLTITDNERNGVHFGIGNSLPVAKR